MLILLLVHEVFSLLTSESVLYSPLQNTFYSQYSLNISMGSQSQILPFVLGLQTSWTWVLSTPCTCSSKFTTTSSNTFTKLGENLTLNFEIGSIESEKSMDQLKISNKLLKNFKFLASFKENDLNAFKSSGVLGLGLRQTDEDFPSFLDALMDEGIIEEKIFSIYLAPKGEDKESFVTFGGYFEESGMDMVKVKANITGGFWVVGVDHVEFGGVYYDINPQVFVDVGTSMVYIDKRITKKIKKYLKNKYKCYSNRDYFCVIPSEDIESLSKFTISLSGVTFDIPAKHYLSCESTTCKVLISSLPSNNWILGIPFLLSYYSIYDIQQSQIAFPIPSVQQSSLIFPASLVIFAVITFVIYYKPQENFLFYQKI